MNKGITLLILLVIVTAMGMLYYTNSQLSGTGTEHEISFTLPQQPAPSENATTNAPQANQTAPLGHTPAQLTPTQNSTGTAINTTTPAQPAPQPTTPQATPQQPQPQTGTQAPEASAPTLKEIQSITIQSSKKKTSIKITASGPVTFRSLVLDKPNRFVLDLAGEWKDIPEPQIGKGTLVKGVRVGKQEYGPRLVFDLSTLPKVHQASKTSDRTIEITLQ